MYEAHHSFQVERRHLLTRQENVSETQFLEMTEANVQFVVPNPVIGKYSNETQLHLQTVLLLTVAYFACRQH